MNPRYPTYLFLITIWNHILGLSKSCLLCYQKTPLCSLTSATSFVPLLPLKDKTILSSINTISFMSKCCAQNDYATATHTTCTTEGANSIKNTVINIIKLYRNVISPIMPPNCRFVPTCSVYAIDSINKYGLIKGLILTVWRIFRCNPTGGFGYDPPRWPPPPYKSNIDAPSI